MATIYDVAKASGVSATTVSHVLNHTRYVSPQIAERVMTAVKELKYEPIRRRDREEKDKAFKRGSMGFIIDRRLLTVCGCRAYVRMSDRYEWITISVDGVLTEKQLLRYMKQYHLSRVLVHQSVEFECADDPANTVNPGSILLLNQEAPSERADLRHLMLDYESAVKVALGHLLRCGHTNITVVGGDLNQFCQRQIMRALKWFNKQYAAQLNQDNIVWLSGEHCASLLEQGSFGTAVISIGVPGIMAVTKYGFHTGCHAPQDFSWIAVDDDDYIQGYNPDVTCVKLDPSVFHDVLNSEKEPKKRTINLPKLVIKRTTSVLPRDPQGEQAGSVEKVTLSITEKMLVQKQARKLGVSFAQADTLYSQMIWQGIKEAAANLNLELLPMQNARLDSSMEKNQLVWLLQNDANAIISVSNDHTEMVEMFHRLSRSSDVPLILGSNLPVRLSPVAYHSCIATNDEEKGRQAAQFLAEQMLPRGMQRLVMLIDKSTDVGAQQCVRALITALYGDYSQIQVLEQVEASEGYSVEDFEKLYRRLPEMQGLYIQNAGAAAKISGWLHANGRDDVVVVTSQISSSVAQRMLQNTSGRMGIVSSQPLELGHLMAYSAACALLGKPTPKYVAVDPITLNQKNVEELWPLLTQSRLV